MIEALRGQRPVQRRGRPHTVRPAPSPRGCPRLIRRAALLIEALEVALERAVRPLGPQVLRKSRHIPLRRPRFSVACRRSGALVHEFRSVAPPGPLCAITIAGGQLARLTIDIDMEEPRENWEALYGQIEQLARERDESLLSLFGFSSPSAPRIRCEQGPATRESPPPQEANSQKGHSIWQQRPEVHRFARALEPLYGSAALGRRFGRRRESGYPKIQHSWLAVHRRLRKVHGATSRHPRYRRVLRPADTVDDLRPHGRRY